MTKNTFLGSIKEEAISGWKLYKILPSITGAQASLESANGTSKLAKEANNIFGIKGSYNGQSYLHDTWEVNKLGKRIETKDSFRKYPDIQTSIIDRGEFFTSTPWRVENYKHVIGETSYKKAARALLKSVYATDPQYANKLISFIEQNKLYEWDKEAFQLDSSTTSNSYEKLVSQKQKSIVHDEKSQKEKQNLSKVLKTGSLYAIRSIINKFK